MILITDTPPQKTAPNIRIQQDLSQCSPYTYGIDLAVISSDDAKTQTLPQDFHLFVRDLGHPLVAHATSVTVLSADEDVLDYINYDLVGLPCGIQTSLF